MLRALLFGGFQKIGILFGTPGNKDLNILGYEALFSGPPFMKPPI